MSASSTSLIETDDYCDGSGEGNKQNQYEKSALPSDLPD